MESPYCCMLDQLMHLFYVLKSDRCRSDVRRLHVVEESECIVKKDLTLEQFENRGNNSLRQPSWGLGGECLVYPSYDWLSVRVYSIQGS